MSLRLCSLLGMLAVGTAVFGCAAKATLTRTDPARASGPTPSPDRVYDVRITPGDVETGGNATVRFEALPVDPWHVNLAYPARVELAEAPSLGVATVTLTKTDAKILDRGGISFELPVEGLDAGRHVLEGRFLFAMCADGQDCVAVEHEFRVPIPVAAAAETPDNPG